MKKTEIVALGILLLAYLNNIFNLFEISLFAFFNILVFLIISIAGYKLYKPKTYSNEIKASFFAVFCGLAFSLGILSFGAKIWNHSNTVTLVLAIPNFILFSFLLFNIVKSRKNKVSERRHYYSKLFIRSSLLVVLVITILALPYYILNVYINKESTVLHNRGLATLYYNKSMDFSSEEKFDLALNYAKKSLHSSEIAWGKNDTNIFAAYEALYTSYSGLIKEEYSNGNEENVLQYAKAIKKPIKIWFGDSTKQEALTNTFVAKIHQDRGNYELSDSLYIQSLHILERYYKTKNVTYVRVLNLLANSYRNQSYFKDAESLYKTSLYHLENDTIKYTNVKNPSTAISTIPTCKANTYAEMAWNYTLFQQNDKATVFFDKAFKIPTYKNHENYSLTLTRQAYNYLYNDDFNQAKKIMDNALAVALEKYGEADYNYISALKGLITINTSLGNYKQAEKGCIKAIALLAKITDKKDEFYARLIYAYGEIKYALADYKSSAELFNQALEYSKENTPQYANILGSISTLNGNLTNYAVALKQAEKASEIAVLFFDDENSPNLPEFFRKEAYINYLIGRYTAANKLYTRSFRIDTLNKNQKKTSFASTLNGIGLIKTQKNKYKEADTLFEKSLKIYKSIFGENHPNYATLLYNKACLELERKKLDASEKLFNRSLNIFKEVINDKHDMVADNLVGLGEINIKRNKFQYALNYFEEAITIYKEKFVPEHKKIVLTADYIEFCKKRIK